MQSKKTYSFVICLLSFVLILFSFFLFLFSCQRSTAPDYNPQHLQLQVLDVSCTEAWLSLKAKNDYLNKTLKLFQDDSLKLEKNLTAEDSILFVENLWPNTSYQFKVAIYDGNKLIAKSSTVNATTMDTTSHSFTWQNYLFGGLGTTSILRDVAIIQPVNNEEEIWAVGEIKTDSGRFNAAHWDGEKWELKKILFHTFCDRGTLIPYPAKAIFFIDNTLLISSGSEITFIKNGNQIKNQCTPVSINKIWGTSSSDLYVVGNNGLIAHYDGQQWQRIESGTDLNIFDIWGGRDENGKYQILCVASKHLEDPLFKRKIFKIENNQAIEVATDPIQWDLSSIWFIPNRKYYAAGAGIFTNYRLKNSPWNLNLFSLSEYYIYQIRGTALNDIYAVGGCGEFLHFNGLAWKSFLDTRVKYQRQYYSMDVKGNIAVAIGFQGVQTLISVVIK